MVLSLRPVANLAIAIAQFPDVAARAADERFEFFEKKIRPVLIEHC